MWKTSLIQFFKIIRQNKFFTFLNLFGISITMMIILVAAIKIDTTIWPGDTEKNNDNMLFMNRLMFKNDNSTSTGSMNLIIIEDYLEKMKTPEAIAFSSEQEWSYIGEHGVEDFLIRSANSGLWQVFDFEFIEGRPFNNIEEKNAELVAVIDQTIKNRFFSDKPAIGKMLQMSGKSYKVIGIIKDVAYNCMQSKGNVFIPYTVDDMRPPEIQETGRYNVTFLTSGKSNAKEIKAEIDQIHQHISGLLENDYKMYFGGPDSPVEMYLRGYDVGEFYSGHKTSAMILLGKFLLLMLLPAINMISIQLTRIHERSEEVGVRKSFGATKKQLIWQILYENTLLTFMGSILGLILAILMVYGLKDTIMPSLFESPGGKISIQINYGVFLVTMIGSLVLSLISGLIPAIKMSKVQPATVLKGGEL